MQLTEATLDDILKGTSRAFYLSLAVLPAGARSPLSLAYLIARAADTIADAPSGGPSPEGGSGSNRLALLFALKAALVTTEPWGEDSETAAKGLRPEKPQEQRLLASVSHLIDLLNRRPDFEREAIRQVVGTLIDGMLWDQRLFGDHDGQLESEASSYLQGCRNQAWAKYGLDNEQLEKYTYMVAGCVGPFWSKICALSDPRLGHLAHSEHDGLAAEFGKGLQWVNILRDVPRDHQAGRYYLPQLQATAFSERFRSQAQRAIEALTEASRYPLLFPNHFLRHRMAVFWPLVLGLRTLEKLLKRGGPRPGERVKVQRWEVLVWVLLSPILVLNDTVLSYVLGRLGRQAERALDSLEDHHAKNL